MFGKEKAPWLRETRATVALAVPIIAGQLSQMLMGLVDTKMVGGVSDVALAASAFANNVVMPPFVWGIGLTTCVAVRVAEAYGAKNHRESGEVLRHGLLLATVAGLLLALVIWLLSFQLHRFGQDPLVVTEARPFLVLIGISVLPTLMAMTCKQYSEAQASAWVPTFIILGSVPMNAFLNWILIYGNLGAPALGLVGAGIATLLARVFSLAGMAAYVLAAPRFRAAKPVSWHGAVSWKRMVSMLRLGLPASLQILVEVSAFAAGGILVGWINKESLAAHQITLTWCSAAFMVPFGLAMAASMRVGHAVGAGDGLKIRAIGTNALVLTLLIMSCSALGFATGGRFLASWMMDNPEVVNLAAGLFVFAALFQFVDGLQITSACLLRGLSDATVPMFIGLLAYWVLALPLGYWLAFTQNWGARGIWAGFALGLLLAATLLVARFWSRSHPRRFEKKQDSSEEAGVLPSWKTGESYAG